MSQQHHQKKNKVPETVTGGEGTAKRNILRRGGPGRDRKEGLAGKSVDDGSIYQDPYALDEKDPNYDSEEDNGKVRIPKYILLQRQEIGQSKLTLTSYKKLVMPIIAEYFVSKDIENVVVSLQEIDAPEYSYEFVKRLINAAIDNNFEERELASRLLSELYPDILSSNMIGKGFERLFEIIDEVEIDAPQAPEVLAAFVARAVIDEVLPPSFLADAVVCNLGGDIIDQAKILLSRDHGGAKLERIWGPGDGRPVDELKVAVDQLLLEYILSSDVNEAVRCLQELRSPHFFHEIVKRAITIALDKTPEQQQQISDLLKHLSSIGMLSSSQAQQGFNRLHVNLSDLVLDTPHAPQILHEFTDRAIKDGVLPSIYQAPKPRRNSEA